MSLPSEYFTRMYAVDADPWRFGSRWYEQRKYALTMAALPRARYANAFEPACSIGVLSELLADRCDRLVCCDTAERAVAVAAARLETCPHVTVERRDLPAEWPDGRFDLIVLSELLYYFDVPDLATVLDRALGSLTVGGTLVVAHWRHPVVEYPRSGDEIHAAVRRLGGLAAVAEHREADFLLDVYVRDASGGAFSVAAEEGLA